MGLRVSDRYSSDGGAVGPKGGDHEGNFGHVEWMSYVVLRLLC